MKKIFSEWWGLLFKKEVIGILVVGLMMVLVVKYFGKSQVKELVRIEVLSKKGYNLENPANWIAGALKVGGKEVGVDGKTIVNINQIDSYPQGDEKYKIYLILEMNGIRDKKTGYFIYKGRPVVVGETVDIVFENVKLSGLVTHIGKEVEIKKKTVEVDVRWKSQDPWVVDNVKVGDRSINKGSGEVAAWILDKRTELPSTDIYMTNLKGYVEVAKDPKKKDVLMKIRLKVEDDGGVLVYAGHQKVKVGEPLWIYTESNDMEGVEIMSIKELN